MANLGYKRVVADNLRWGSEFDPTTGTFVPDPNLPHSLTVVHSYWFVEIPVLARYQFNQNKVSPYVEMGFSPNIYITSSSKINTDTGDNVEFNDDTVTSDFNRLNFSGTIAFGLNYQAGARTQLFFQPVFRYHFTRLADAPLKEYLYNYGAELGVRKQLN